jgi:hypothetical protein
MKSRTVIVTVELETAMRISDLKALYEWAHLRRPHGGAFAGTVGQVQANVIRPTKKNRRKR